MPSTLSYPGVYLEEIPSGVRTLTGVATAIAAFVGRTRRGPTNDPTRIFNYGDFERSFGGLWANSTVSYAVRHYFQNGGSDAIIVRVENGAVASSAALNNQLTLVAITRGSDGLPFQVAVTAGTTDDAFTLDITEQTGSVAVDSFDVSVDPDGTAYVTDVIGSGEVVEVSGAVPPLRPDAATATAMTPTARASLTLATSAGPALVLEATDVGAGGNAITVTIADNGASNFDISVTDGTTTDTATNVAPADAATAIGAFALVRIPDDADAITTRPTAGGPTALTGGTDVITLGAAATFPFEAANPGVWGDNLRVTVDHDTKEPSDTTLFNLTITEVDDEGETVREESFRNLSVDDDHARYAPRLLELESALIRLSETGLVTSGARPPEVSAMPLSGGGDGAAVTDADVVGNQGDHTGMYALDLADLFTLLCIPPLTRDTDVAAATYDDAVVYCESRNAMLIMDAPSGWSTMALAQAGMSGALRHKNAALFFPRLKMADPLRENRLDTFAPCGVVAGLCARTDAQRGVWKAPAGLEATAIGVRQLAVKLTDSEQGVLNLLGLNCFRTFPVAGTVLWGSRTTRGADALSDEWKYLPVRRLALFLRESLFRGTQWVVFEPNDEPLWGQIRLNVGSFMQSLFVRRAFQGATPREAYFVKCDSETTTQDDINKGIVNILVGFAPLKPAEFVVVKIQQMAGQAQS